MSDRLSFIEPMMPTLVDKPPVQGEWSVEVKFDGWRCQLVIDADGARVFTRGGHDWTVRLKIIADAATNELVQMNGMKKVKSAIIDGELVYPHVSGRSDFHALQAVVRSHSDKLIFMAFDLLHLNGEDIALIATGRAKGATEEPDSRRWPHPVLRGPGRHARGTVRCGRADEAGRHRLQTAQLAVPQR